jgi:hypothetical protein
MSKRIAMTSGIGELFDANRVTLDFAKDFKLAGPSTYTLRSKVVLNGSR